MSGLFIGTIIFFIAMMIVTMGLPFYHYYKQDKLNQALGA